MKESSCIKIRFLDAHSETSFLLKLPQHCHYPFNRIDATLHKNQNVIRETKAPIESNCEIRCADTCLEPSQVKLSIRSGSIGFSLATRSLDIILYMVVQQKMGLESIILDAPSFLGTKVRIVALAAEGKKAVVKK